MRIMSAISLLTLAAVLGGCGGGASKTLDLTEGDISLCGLSCPTANLPQGTPTTSTPQIPPPTTKPTTGNDVNLAAGNSTIILEEDTITNVSTTNPALSKLKQTTEADGSRLASLEIDTSNSDQSTWPIPKDMELYLSDDGTTVTPDNPTRLPGNDAALGMGATTYDEYRDLNRSSSGEVVDEELQVWHWNNSYGVHYRDASGGDIAKFEAWSFGGKKTKATALKTTGVATYAGRFGSNAKTDSWVDPDRAGQTFTPDNHWRVNGSANMSVNFATAKMRATLKPEVWNARQNKNSAVGFASVSAASTTDPNFFQFMDQDIVLSGTLSADGIAPLATNKIVGRAKMDPANGWVSGKNTSPVFASLFGANGQELTGVFNVEGVIPEPSGGGLPINQDARGFIRHHGVFNGQCTSGC